MYSLRRYLSCPSSEYWAGPKRCMLQDMSLLVDHCIVLSWYTAVSDACLAPTLFLFCPHCDTWENEPKSVLAHKVVSEYATAFHPAPNPTLYVVQHFMSAHLIILLLPLRFLCILFVLTSFPLLCKNPSLSRI
jgi:hypothetical protein